MKYFISLFIILTVLSPTFMRADEALPSDAWAFLYEFPLIYENGLIAQAESYRITTGDAPILPRGSWSLEIVSQSGEQLRWYAFDPASMEVGGLFSLVVPIEYRAATAYVKDASGAIAVTIDVRESRLCNDNGVCDADAGEVRENCSTDCGGATARSASIIQQVSIGERVGGVLLRISSGVAGILLLVGIAQILDRRRRS